MFKNIGSYRRSNYRQMKKDAYKKKHIEEIRAEAESRRDKCYEKKHGRFSSEKICLTQAEYINKYFAVY